MFLGNDEVDEKCWYHGVISVFYFPNTPLKMDLGKAICFREDFWGFFKRIWEVLKSRKKVFGMRKKGYKGRCEKRIIRKCSDVCRTYDTIQSAYANMLQEDASIKEIRCNILLEGLSEGEYTSDFVCIRTDGDMMVRECVQRKYLMLQKNTGCGVA